MHIVYQVQGTRSHYCYIGYCEGNEDTTQSDILNIFLNQTKKRSASEDRGDIRLFTENNSDEQSLSVDILDVFDTEMDAWMCRNEQRSLNHMSITGPTMFPCNIAERAAKEQPESVAAWKLRIKQRGANTARQAWALGLWTDKVIKNLPILFDKKQVVTDLDKLTPDQFAIKYQIGVQNA